MWNSVIRSQIQYYFPVTLIVMTSFKDGEASVVSILQLFCLLFLPAFSYVYLKRNYLKLEHQDFSSSYDSLYLNMFPLKPTVYQMMTIFCVKRLIYGTSTVLLAQYVVPHMYVYIFLPLFFLGFSLVQRPMTSKMLNFKENMNELLILVCAYFIPLFTQWICDPMLRY